MSAHDLWNKVLWHVANFGDLRIAFPIAAILVVWLCAHGRWRMGAWYGFAVLGGSATILCLKLAFFSGVLRLPAVGLQNPSGHSAVSAVVYGSLAWIVAREIQGWRGRGVLFMGCAGVVAVGVSLYLIGVHTASDVLAGLTVGSGFAAVLAWRERGRAPVGGAPVRLILVLAIVALSLQGMHLIARITPGKLLLLLPSVAAPA